jgi:hypothetical protein
MVQGLLRAEDLHAMNETLGNYIPWVFLGLGVALDAASVIAAVVLARRARSTSPTPILSLMLYGVFAGREVPWLLVGLLAAFHVLWHFVLLPGTMRRK